LKQQEDGLCENIVMWDKGCCILHTVAFAVCSDNQAMEDTKQDKITTRDYEEIKRCTIIQNHAKL
jgi:hypothetical protein